MSLTIIKGPFVPASSIVGLTPFEVLFGSPSGGIAQSPLFTFQPDSIFALESIVTPYNTDPAAPGYVQWIFENPPLGANPGFDAPRFLLGTPNAVNSDGVVPGAVGSYSGIFLGNGGDGAAAQPGGAGPSFFFGLGRGGDGTPLAPSGNGAFFGITVEGPGADNGGGSGNDAAFILDVQGAGGLIDLGAALVELGRAGEEIYSRGEHFHNEISYYSTEQQHTALVAAPSNPPVGQVKSYFKTVAGKQFPFYLDSAGIERRIDVDQVSGSVALAANQTTASLVFVAIPGMSLNLTTAEGFLLVWASVSFSNTGVNQQVFIRLLVDGVTRQTQGSLCTAANTPQALCLIARVPVAAGVHTISLQWRVSGGVGQIRPVAAPDAESAVIVAQGVNQ